MKLVQRSQTGFSLVAAIFLLVVLAALGVFMINLSSTQHMTVAYAVQGARAYHAGQSGLEWAISHATTDHDCSAFPTTLNFGAGGLSGFSADLTCAVTSHTEQATTYNVFVLEAYAYTTASPFGSPGYAARRLATTVTDAP